MTVYTAGTTTPAAIFRDAALAVPMSNPTTGADKSDASGRFPQIFAATGSLFDILQKDAGGVTLKSYVSVPSQGVSTATLGLDFTSSRMQFRGSGGTSYVEFGDATGDDVGGTGVIEGWNGTQADSITLNGASVNVAGRLKENTYKIPGVIRQENGAFTGVASVAIPLTNEPAGVRLFEVDILDLTLSAAAVLSITFSFDGGSTYTAANYAWAINGSYLTTASLKGSAADTSGFVADAFASGGNAMIRMSIATPTAAAVRTLAMGQWAGNLNTLGFAAGVFSVYVPTSGRATHMKLAAASGTISGVYRVVPLRGLGET